MNRLLLCVGSAAAALVLAACGGDDDTPAAPASPTVTVDDATTGAYVVSVGTADALAVGKYYAAADGSRLLVLQGADDRVSQLYRRASAGAAWIPVPAASTATTVTLATRAAVAVTSPTAAALAGKYRVAIDGGHADFTLGADGVLTAGTLPGTLKLTLATSGCGALPASATGVLVADPDFAPAAFRLVADNDKVPVDLWAYAKLVMSADKGAVRDLSQLED